MESGDEVLLSELRSSDRRAYEILFRKYFGPLFRQVWYRCKDRDLAEDIVQEAFVRIWTGRAELKPRLPLFPFLITISLNLLRDNQKHSLVAQRHRESVKGSGGSAEYPPDEQVSVALLQDRISDVVNRHLSEKCRSIFVLSRIEGRSNSEIAELLEISTKAVENQLYHAIKVLRRKLSSYK